MNGVYLVGGNLVSDSALRKKLAGRDAGVELQMVLEDLFAGWTNDKIENPEDNKNKVLRKQETMSQEKFERNQLKITLKVFLRDFTVESLLSAVDSALSQIGCERVDSLFLAVPTEATPIIGIGSGSTGTDHTEALKSLVNLWRVVEGLVQNGRVGGAVLCDLRPSVFIALYNEAVVKPTSIQINQKSCCVIPEELNEFARENNVTVLTHSDPEELLPEDSLRKLLYPHLGREAGHFSPNWISRYLIHLKDRGVLTEKRYLVQLSK